MKATRRFGFPTVVLISTALLLAFGSLAIAAGEDMPAAGQASATSTGPPARLGMVRAGVSPEATTLTLEVSGDFTYFSSTPGERLVFVDLPHVLSTQASDSHLVESKLISSYRVVPYLRGDLPCSRIEVLLKQPSITTYQQMPGALQIKFVTGRGRDAAPPPAPVPAGASAVPPQKRAARPEAAPSNPARLLARGNAIEKVAFNGERGSTLVQILANGPVEYRTFALANPRRLVLDIPNTESRVSSREIPVGLPPVKSIRAAQFSRAPLVSRVVLELEDASPYNVQLRGNILEVEWRRDMKASPEGVPARPFAEPKAVLAAAAEKQEEPPAPPAVAAADTIKAVELPPVPSLAIDPPAPRSAPRAELSAEADKPDPPATAVVAAANTIKAVEQPPVPSLAIDPPAPRSAPRAELSADAVKPDTPAPAAKEPDPPAPVNVKANPPAAPKSTEAPVQAPQPPAPPVQPAAPPQAAPAQALSGPGVPVPARYTGEPISVNLKDVDLKDFFRLIHEVSGLNIVLDPVVSGRVTLVMEDVPWDQVLDIVLRNNGLDKQLEGNVLRIAQRDTLRREEESRLALETAKQAGVERVTVMRPVNYARATQLMTTLMKFRSPRGELVADERTNTLIITDIPQVIPTIDDIIRQLDRRSVQVEIEARVVSASRNFARDVGTQFGFGTTATGGRTVFGGNIQGSSATSPVNSAAGLPPTRPFNAASPSILPALLPALPLFSNFPVAATSGLTLTHRSPNFAVDLIISLAESKGLAKTLSRPRIITQNNVQGTVQQGLQVPVQTTINNTVSAQMVNATLTLQVRPQVTNDGSIFLEITVENNSLNGFSPPPFSQPLIATQRATTSVLVNDGDTIVFGGVVTNDNTMSTAQVPVLGSVPVLGHLFKNNRVATDTKELLFFITPRIV